MIVTNELEKMCKQAAIASFKLLSRNLPTGTEKKSKKTAIRIIDVLAEIPTEHLSRMSEALPFPPSSATRRRNM
jgi:hypothetical protein